MRFLLDANALVAVLNGHAGFLARMREHRPSDFAVSTIVAHELFDGAFKSARTVENLRRVDALRFEMLDFDPSDARRSGEIRATLASLGTPIGPYDVLIAGQAVARDLTLVTRNLREFARVQGLRVENWEG